MAVSSIFTFDDRQFGKNGLNSGFNVQILTKFTNLVTGDLRVQQSRLKIRQ